MPTLHDQGVRGTVGTRRALLLINHRAGKAKAMLPGITSELRAHGFELVTGTSCKPEELTELLRRHPGEIDLVIVGGGDGTFNRVVDVLVGSGLPLGILPLGTANDLARTLGIPIDPLSACRVIAEGHTRQIDLGLVNGKHFFNVASMGLSVRITRNLTREVKRRWGVLAYLLTSMQVLWRARPFHAEIRTADSLFVAKTMQIAVGNGRFYGGGMAVAEDAAIDDQRLDLYSLEIGHWWQLLGILPRLRCGRLADLPLARTFHAAEIEIRTQRPQPINTDGEITTRTPAVFSLVPRALTVFAPPPEEQPI